MNAPTHPTNYLPIHTHTHTQTAIQLFAYHCVHTTNHPPTSIHFPFQHARARCFIEFYRSNSKVIAGSVCVCVCVYVRGSLDLCSSMQRIYIHQISVCCHPMPTVFTQVQLCMAQEFRAPPGYLKASVRSRRKFSFVMSVRLSACISAAPTGQIYGRI